MRERAAPVREEAGREEVVREDAVRERGAALRDRDDAEAERVAPPPEEARRADDDARVVPDRLAVV